MTTRERENVEGQAITEYLILLSVIVSGFLLVAREINQSGLTSKLMQTLTGSFANAYQYGKIDAKGYDDQGGPIRHPRAIEGGNFRIFINPR